MISKPKEFKFWDFRQRTMTSGKGTNVDLDTLPPYIIPLEYTTLDDMDGNKIFEGDILHFCDGYEDNYDVAYWGGGWCLDGCCVGIPHY